MRKKLIFVSIVIIIVGIGIYEYFFRGGKPSYSTTLVKRGDISQEVSETGTVKMGEKINLSFKNTGKIKKIYVKVGDLVKSGQILAKLDAAQLEVQLQEAQAALEVAKAKLDKLLAGATPEEIKVAETDVKNSQISLDIAKENLDQAYKDALNILDDSYLKLYNASNTVDSVQRSYFNTNDQESVKVKENKKIIEDAMSEAKSYLDITKENPKNENIETALSEMKNSLNKTSDALAIIREVCETPSYRNEVSSTDKTSLDNQRTNINTALTNVTNSQQNISSMKLSKEAAEGKLQKTKDQLAKIEAEPQQEDIDLYQAQIKQAKAKINLLETKIEDATLKSPTKGEITEINKREGEIVQPVLAESVISLLPTSPFQIEVDIYEEDIVKIKVGNPVDITLAAFPNEILKGRVVSIDPAEKLIEGVVYYEVTIDFEKIEVGIKPGMTADVVIKTAFKKNVLTIPKNAIQKKDDKITVQVFKNAKIKEREIKTGLWGSNDMVEVISGLKEGEMVVLK